MSSNAAILAQTIKSAKREHQLSLDQLSVLSNASDPYRLDTKAGHRLAEWWMENSEPGTGLMSGHGLGHSDALWYVRGRPRLKDVWATLLGTDDLIVSFDGCCLFRPWGIEPSWRTASGCKLAQLAMNGFQEQL